MAEKSISLGNLQRYDSNIKDLIDGKQDLLTAGTGITIDGDVISSSVEIKTMSNYDIDLMFPTDGLAYTLLSGGTAYACSGIGGATDTDIVIASEYNGLPVTEIQGSAFRNNTSITSVKIPDTVKRFTSGYVFSGCTSLRSVNIGKGFEDFYPWSGTFEGCSNLENVTLNNNIKSIGYNCFANCKISIIDLPNKLLSVGASAFYNNTLTEIVLPDTVNAIGDYAFDRNQMTKATILATTPPTLNNVNAFNGSYPIYVPAESVEAYKAATNWASLASRIQAIQE